MSIDVAAMQEQIRRAALSLLPEEPNATWERPVASPVNDLGEPTTAHPTATPVRVFFAQLRARGSDVTAAGAQPRSTPRFLVAPAAGDTSWSPSTMDILLKDGERWRVIELKRLDVDGTYYFDADAERIL